TDADFEAKFVNSAVPVLVDFWAPWCGPCKMIAPLVDEIVKEYEGKLLVAKLNVDDSPATAQKYNVMGIPTLLFFKSGKPVKQLVGYQEKPALQKAIDEVTY
ncbi:MAG: thioredoxin, partial [bacterium]|nr:thioredoxin [bacterium]